MSRAAQALDLLVAMARRDPLFLGCGLAQYQLTHNLDAASLAAWLGCGRSALSRLSLCRMPDDRSGRFPDDIIKIARFASCDPDRLMHLLREVFVLGTLEGGSLGDRAGLLAAARDRRREGPGAPAKPERGEES
jgi:hypothetical protein